jgi:hypothetical protein
LRQSGINSPQCVVFLAAYKALAIEICAISGKDCNGNIFVIFSGNTPSCANPNQYGFRFNSLKTEDFWSF